MDHCAAVRNLGRAALAAGKLPAMLFQMAKLAQHAIPTKFPLRAIGLLISVALAVKQKGRVAFCLIQK
jgi:hypothetical protein